MPIDMVQRLVVEVDSIKLLEEYLRLVMATALNSNEELAVKIVDRKEKNLILYLPPPLSNQEKHFPIILVGGWYISEEGKENSYFNGYRPWETFKSEEETSAVDTAIRHIKNLIKEYWTEWSAEFKKKFGDGYNAFFNIYDGSVGLGYELRTCNCFPEQLAISIVHMYYGE
ncbi:hypothetical protein KKB71_01035 [Patescibacteria group bacterium]|nr:hypothetical protein [Patescibacteria group bacterium]MBU2263446.1 hypothetical protein [Patescibacteria group bacterium]